MFKFVVYFLLFFSSVFAEVFIIGIKDDANADALKKFKDFLVAQDAIIIQEYTVGSMAVQLPKNYISIMDDLMSFEVVDLKIPMSTVNKMSNESVCDKLIEFDEWIKDPTLSVDSYFLQSQKQNDSSDLSWLSDLDQYISPSLSISVDDDYSNIMEYFTNLTSELSLVMLHPTVVQKSYQNEKRFMAPQPLIYLIGDGWPIAHSDMSINIKDSFRDRSAFSGQVFEENDRVDLLTEASYLRSLKGIKMNYTKVIFKSLFVSEADKLKSINLSFSLDIGSKEKKRLSFLSKEIKIISKPSKKKFLTKGNNEYAITSGSMVALFNRFKSQSISTRYLGYSSKLNFFIGKSNDYDAFLIWNVQDPRLPSFETTASNLNALNGMNSLIEGEITSSQGFESSDAKYWTLKYGQIVRLQHVQTGLISKPFVLCRVADRNWIEYNLCVGEMAEPLSQVSQLQRIALMAINENFEFMSLEQESIKLLPSIRGESFHNAGHFELEEGSIWTLCSIDQTEFSFYIPKSVQLQYLNLENIPHVFSMNKISETQASIFGTNLNPNLQAYFGMIKVFQIIRHSTNYWILNFPLDKPETGHDYPLLLVDQQGVVFKTPFYL